MKIHLRFLSKQRDFSSSSSSRILHFYRRRDNKKKKRNQGKSLQFPCRLLLLCYVSYFELSVKNCGLCSLNYNLLLWLVVSDHGIMPGTDGDNGVDGGHSGVQFRKRVSRRRSGGEASWSTKCRIPTICWICQCGLQEW